MVAYDRSQEGFVIYSLNCVPYKYATRTGVMGVYVRRRKCWLKLCCKNKKNLVVTRTCHTLTLSEASLNIDTHSQRVSATDGLVIVVQVVRRTDVTETCDVNDEKCYSCLVFISDVGADSV